LLSEIGPLGDFLVGMLLKLSHHLGTLNENRTPFSVTVCLKGGLEAGPALAADREGPGCAVAAGEDEGETRVMPTTATTSMAAAAIAALATLFKLANLRIVLLLRRVARELLAETMRCGCFRSISDKQQLLPSRPGGRGKRRRRRRRESAARLVRRPTEG
jgi:hypothetical protein